MSLVVTDEGTVDLRRNVLTLSDPERAAFVTAIREIKAKGIYDKYVEWHHHAMMHATPTQNETPHWRYRNAAHRGPAFLPWHRWYIRQFELDLKRIEPSVTLPYWDWSADAALPDPKTSPVWSPDLMGGNGLEAFDWVVMDGPFAFRNGWMLNVRTKPEGPELRRGFGKFRDPFGQLIETLPTKQEVASCLLEPVYDVTPWDSSTFAVAFRARLEGWVTQSGDDRVRFPGVQLHNRVHVWVGGTMRLPTSPNDPVFFIHQFVDKLWADWQALKKKEWEELQAEYPHDHSHGHHFDPAAFYQPHSGGPAGHNIDDQMFPFGKGVTPKSVLDHHAMGYKYDTDETPKAGTGTFDAHQIDRGELAFIR